MAGTVRGEAEPSGMRLHELRSMLRLAGPLIVVQLGQIGMNTTDTIMVGPLGPEALAAVGLGSALYIFGTLVCTGVILGMTPVVSQAFGAGELDRCDRAFVQGLWLALLLSIPVVWTGLRGEPIMSALGQPAEVVGPGGEYMRAVVWSAPALFLFMACRQYLEGTGTTRPSMVITLLGLVLNVPANRVLIYGVPALGVPALGPAGTGWATTVVRWTMLAVMVGYLVRRRRETGAGERWTWRPDPRMLGAITRIGVPVGMQFGLEVGIFTLAAVMMGWIGPVELAAHQITINIASTTFMVALGTSMAGSIRVGQHVGAGRQRAVSMAVVTTYALATGFMALCAVTFLVLPEQLIGIYSRDADVVRVGVQLLLFAALFQVFDGAQVAGVSVLRGMADTAVPMAVCAVGYWVIALPLAYVLGFRLEHGAPGVWAGLSAGLAVVAVLLLWRVRTRVTRGTYTRVG